MEADTGQNRLSAGQCQAARDPPATYVSHLKSSHGQPADVLYSGKHCPMPCEEGATSLFTLPPSLQNDCLENKEM